MFLSIHTTSIWRVWCFFLGRTSVYMSAFAHLLPNTPSIKTGRLMGKWNAVLWSEWLFCTQEHWIILFSSLWLLYQAVRFGILPTYCWRSHPMVAIPTHSSVFWLTPPDSTVGLTGLIPLVVIKWLTPFFACINLVLILRKSHSFSVVVKGYG